VLGPAIYAVRSNVVAGCKAGPLGLDSSQLPIANCWLYVFLDTFQDTFLLILKVLRGIQEFHECFERE